MIPSYDNLVIRPVFFIFSLGLSFILFTQILSGNYAFESLYYVFLVCGIAFVYIMGMKNLAFLTNKWELLKREILLSNKAIIVKLPLKSRVTYFFDMIDGVMITTYLSGLSSVILNHNARRILLPLCKTEMAEKIAKMATQNKVPVQFRSSERTRGTALIVFFELAIAAIFFGFLLAIACRLA